MDLGLKGGLNILYATSTILSGTTINQVGVL